MQAAIYGPEGPVLTEDERAFFRDADPAGYIFAEYNQEKDRTTIEETFRRLVELVKSLTMSSSERQAKVSARRSLSSSISS